ncbi:MAG: hypothetical protein ACI8P7_001314 [Candidatus Azotimanducaceae bacterium]|jgi:hypothetical protein
MKNKLCNQLTIYMKQIHFSRKKRQLARLADDLKLAIENKTEEVIGQIKLKIHLLLKELAGSVSKHQLRGILGALAIFFGLGLTNTAEAQKVFAAPVENPFGLVGDTAGFSFPEFIDMDGDGDLDIVLGTYSEYNYSYNSPIVYYENIGTAANPSFGPVQSNPFGLDSVYIFGAPAAADLDGDGDMDLIVGEYYGNVKYFENTGTASTPSFAAPVDKPFGLSPTSYLNLPAIADLDNDGDQDVLFVEAGGGVSFFENTGTANSPAFASPVFNPFGLDTNENAFVPKFGDMDNDGDLDLLLGGYNDTSSAGGLYYYENIGTQSAPNFATAVLDPFELQPVDDVLFFLALGDLDADGDLDLLQGYYYGTFNYYQLNDFVGIAEEQFESKLYPNPTSNILNIESEKTIVTIEVTDLTGRVVMQSNNFNKQLDVSDLSAGMYIISLTDVDNAKSVQKFTKK